MLRRFDEIQCQKSSKNEVKQVYSMLDEKFAKIDDVDEMKDETV